MRIAMIGTGYVGLVSGACFADFGHKVVCVDKDVAKIAALRDGEIPIYEPASRARRQQSRAGRLSFTTESRAVARRRRGVHRGGHAVAARRRPRRPDLCLSAAREIADALDGFTVVVTKSTVPVGTGDEVERIMRETRSRRRRSSVVSNPEFLREGAAIHDFKHPDRIVVGTEDERARKVMPRSIGRSISTSRRSVHRPAHRRADQIRRQRVPGDQDHLHQRDRRPLREGRRRRQEVARGIGLDNRIGGKFLHRRARLRRLLLSQGHAGAGADRPRRTRAAAHRRDHVAVNDARKSAMAARSRAFGGDGPRQDHRGARPHLQAQHRRHARGARLADHPGCCRLWAPIQAYDPEGHEARPLLRTSNLRRSLRRPPRAPTRW